MRSWIQLSAAESRRVSAADRHVTSPLCCPRIRASSRPVLPAWAPRPARDIRTPPQPAALATLAVARAHPRGRPARVSLVVVGRACASELVGTPRCTCADGPQPTAPAGRRICTQYNIGGVATASRHAYPIGVIDRAGSILASTPGSILASVED